MLALDLSEQVIEQAKAKDCSMIVAYHPPWFKAVKRLTQEPASEARLIGLCAAHGMSVYSPHTAADNVYPGANDWVVSQVLAQKIMVHQAMQPSAVHGDTIGAGRLVAIRPTAFSEVLETVSRAFNLPIRTYCRVGANVCSC
jgi:putative NIF3 family GTP cyclohydrolase 1 type 2